MSEEARIAEPAAAAEGGRVAASHSRLRDLLLVARLDITEALRARWFALYAAAFGALVVAMFVFGLTESRILGFLGLSRLLVTYIQVCMAVVPIFILISTVRSLAGDREAGVFEYLLSLPVSLAGWFWGKLVGRFVVIFLPLFAAMAGAAGWAMLQQIPVPGDLFALYTGLLASLAWCFLGLGMLISSLARSTDVAQGAAFAAWLVLVLFLDLILLGVMVQEQVRPETVVAIALANPLQVFRTAAMLLFDPDLVLLGPSAFVILDVFGRPGYLVWALLYPLALGSGCAAAGYAVFRRGDLP